MFRERVLIQSYSYIPGVNLFMDKLVPESAENAASAGKPKLSDSSIELQEENKASMLEATSIKAENIEAKLDVSSETVTEPLPDSALEILFPSTSQSSDGSKAEYQPSKIVLIGTAHVSEKSVA